MKEFVYTVKNVYQNEKALRDGVGILEEWGVQITKKTKIQAPVSSWVSEGLAAPQKGLLEVRPGGDYQALFSMPDIPKSWILNTTKAFP